MVWDYFDYDDERDKSLCQALKSPTSDSDLSDPSALCGHEVPGKFPTNLKQHLKKAHPGPYAEMIKKETQEEEEKAKQMTANKKKIIKG